MTIDSEQMDANIRSINSTEIGAILHRLDETKIFRCRSYPIV